MNGARRIVITICHREDGVAALPVERGGPIERLDADGVARALEAIVARRGLGDLVTIRAGCAGGCSNDGPNVTLTFHAVTRPGERPDNVSLGWKTYVASLHTLDCLARVIDDHVTPPAGGRSKRT